MGHEQRYPYKSPNRKCQSCRHNCNLRKLPMMMQVPTPPPVHQAQMVKNQVAARLEHRVRPVTSGARTCWVGIPEIQQGTQCTFASPQNTSSIFKHGSALSPLMCKGGLIGLFKDVVLELVGNLYGRRPAGSNYRKEFEQLVTEKMDTKGYSFQRGKRDPTV